jgi:O-antigen/teichoic acid export membrane protein
LAATPLYAVLAATYPRFFAKGAEDGLRGTWGYAKRLMVPVAAYAAAAGAGLFVVAPLVDDVLGSGYTDTISVIRWMAVIPLIHLPALLAGEALTGAGFQTKRNQFIIGAGALNVALNLALIGPYGVDGVIVATYASEIFLLVGLVVWIRNHVAISGEPNG